MEKQKADRMVYIYTWSRVIILVLFLGLVIIGLTNIYNT